MENKKWKNYWKENKLKGRKNIEESEKEIIRLKKWMKVKTREEMAGMKRERKKKTKSLGGENAREEGRLQIGHTLLSWPLQTNSA